MDVVVVCDAEAKRTSVVCFALFNVRFTVLSLRQGNCLEVSLTVGV